jgi:hypothetical protein
MNIWHSFRIYGIGILFIYGQSAYAETNRNQLSGNPNQDLDVALHCGVDCLSNILNPEDGNRPYFECFVFDKPRMEFNCRLSVGNVTGRCLYALLIASQALGIKADPEIIEKYRVVLLESYNNGTGLPADPKMKGGILEEIWTFNSGQGMRGLLGLTLFQRDAVAKEILDKAISSLQLHYVNKGFSWKDFAFRFGLSDGGTGGMDKWPGPNPLRPAENPFLTWSVARYARISNSNEARNLAQDLGLSRFDYRFPKDGLLRLQGNDHGFELAAVTNALAEIGTLLDNEHVMERVKSRIDNGLSQVMSQCGWFPERLSIESDVGEGNNTAEIVEACLLMGDWGWTEYFGLAERYTRAHLLPSQLLDVSMIPPSPSNPSHDGESRVRERVRGAFGFPAPYGHLATRNPYLNGAFMFDIVSGVVACLAEVRQHCYRARNNSHYINLLFDIENENISIKSPYHGDQSLTVTLKKSGDIFIRQPNWMTLNNMKARVTGRTLPIQAKGGYISIPNPPLNEEIHIECPLPLYETTEILNGRTLHILWRGDSVVGMDSMGTQYPFFPEIEEARERIQMETLGSQKIMISSSILGIGNPMYSSLIEEVPISPASREVKEFDGEESRIRYRLPFFPDEEYTFEAWIKPTTGSAHKKTPQRICSAWHNLYDDPLRISILSGQVFAGLETNGRDYETEGVPIRSGEWTHIAAIKNATDLYLHVNGERKAHVEVPERIMTRSKYLGIGFNPVYFSGEFYQGAIGRFTFRACALDEKNLLHERGVQPEY